MQTIRRGVEYANTIVHVTTSKYTTMLWCSTWDNSVIYSFCATPGATRRNWKEKSKSSSRVTSAKRCGNSVPIPLHPCSLL